jgi:hypothetical protein
MQDSKFCGFNVLKLKRREIENRDNNRYCLSLIDLIFSIHVAFRNIANPYSQWKMLPFPLAYLQFSRGTPHKHLLWKYVKLSKLCSLPPTGIWPHSLL